MRRELVTSASSASACRTVRVERMARDDGVEAVAERRRRQRPRDEPDEIEPGLGERRDRRVQRARAMVGDERERRPRIVAAGAEPRVRRDRDEARERGAVADVVAERDEPVERRRLDAGDRDRGGIPGLRRLARGVRRRRRRHGDRVRQPVEEPPALLERGRVRAHDADLVERDLLPREQAVPDRQHGLGDDRDRPLVQQVVRLVHRAHERALDRQHAVRGVGVRRPRRRPRGSRRPPASCARGWSAAAAAPVCDPAGPGYATTVIAAAAARGARTAGRW